MSNVRSPALASWKDNYLHDLDGRGPSSVPSSHITVCIQIPVNCQQINKSHPQSLAQHLGKIESHTRVPKINNNIMVASFIPLKGIVSTNTFRAVGQIV